MEIEMSNQTILTNPEDQKKLLDMLREASNSLARIESERELIREMKKNICDELLLEKKVLNKMVKVYHKQTFQEEVAEHETFETLYGTVVK
jgi:hypothetical protein